MVYAAVPAIPENREIRSRLERMHGGLEAHEVPEVRKEML